MMATIGVLESRNQPMTDGYQGRKDRLVLSTYAPRERQVETLHSVIGQVASLTNVPECLERVSMLVLQGGNNLP